MQADVKPASEEKWCATFLKAESYQDWVQHGRGWGDFNWLGVQDMAMIVAIIGHISIRIIKGEFSSLPASLKKKVCMELEFLLNYFLLN
jgi:hypothetical protein